MMQNRFETLSTHTPGWVRAWPVAVTAFAAVFALCAFDGYYFYDDAAYARYAASLARGSLVLNEENFSHRLGLILPLAAAYRLFGVGDASTLWLPAACTLGALAGVGVVLRRQPWLAAWAVALLGLDFYTLFFANKLYPDVCLTAAALLAAVSLLRRGDGWMRPVVFVAANFWGLLSKETVVYLLPFYALVLATDWRQHQHRLFWQRAFLMGIPVLAAYFGAYAWHTGQPLMRFQTIQEGHYTASYSYFDKPLAAVLRRITYEPLLMLVHSGMAFTVAGAVPCWCTRPFWQWRRCNDELFWSRMAASGLAMFWFFTTSFLYYNPNALFPRMILFLMPACAMASAYAWRRLTVREALAVALLLGAAAWTAAATGSPKLAVPYGVLAAGLAGLAAWRRRNPARPVPVWLLAAVSAVLAVHPVYTLLKPTETGYRAEKHLVQRHLTAAVAPAVVFTDDKLLHGYDFYYGFRVPAALRFASYDSLPAARPAAGTRVFVLVNPHSVGYLEQVGMAPPGYIMRPPQAWRRVAVWQGVQLYEKRNEHTRPAPPDRR